MNTSRNIYRNDVDFAQLAMEDADFNKYLRPNGQVNFGDPDAVRQLTISLLKRDFNLTLTLPPNRLCPPVPNRLNYVLWIQDLLVQTIPIPNTALTSTSHPPSSSKPVSAPPPLLALDIGTGSSAIYPLLFSRTPPPPLPPPLPTKHLSSTSSSAHSLPPIHFLATDIDPLNLQHAHTNISTNNLTPQIHLLERPPSSPLLPTAPIHQFLTQNPGSRLAFTTCNPPFYSSAAELTARAAAKSRPPGTACTGAAVEMVAPGGEVAFAGRIVAESRDLAGPGSGSGPAPAPALRCCWFSCMLGKLSSVAAVVGGLRAAGCANWAVTEFVQGTRTRRWAVAWCWGGWRPGVGVARGLGAGAEATVGREVYAFPGEVAWKVAVGVREVGDRVDEVMKGLELRWVWRWGGDEDGEDGGRRGKNAGGTEGDGVRVGFGFARENVWSRSARRKLKRKDVIDEMEKDDAEDDEQTEPALGFKVTVEEDKDNNTEVHVRWLVGQDSILFESFCGMLKRSITIAKS